MLTVPAKMSGFAVLINYLVFSEVNDLGDHAFNNR